MREHDRGRVFCTLGQVRVHTNGLCVDYRSGTYKVHLPGRHVVRVLTWREKVIAAINKGENTYRQEVLGQAALPGCKTLDDIQGSLL